MSMVYLLVVLGVVLIAVITNLSVSRKAILLTSDEDIARAARSGELIVAVKSYRALHGVGVKQAKDRVLALAASAPRT